jgi:predicted extracellular nuclease
MLAALLPLSAAPVAADSHISISEIRIDQPSTDNDEFFELAGAAGAPLDGLTYLVIGDGTGGSGVLEAIVDLTGQAVPASGFFVAAESTFTLGTADLTTSLNFENSDNVTHLLVSGFSGANGDDLDTNDDGTLDVTPWSTIVDSVALVETVGSGELVYSTTTVGPDGTFVPGHVSLCPAGWAIGEFDPAGGDDTPGTTNNCPAPELAPLVINEIDYDQEGTDGAEFVEIKNVSAAAVSLNGWTLELVNGTAGGAAIYNTIDLPDVSLAVGDYFVVCGDPANVAACDLDSSPDTNLIQNGDPDAIGLRAPDMTLVDAVSYEGDTGAPYTEGSGAGLLDDPSVTAAGISRSPDGVDTDQNNVDLSLRCISPGEANVFDTTDCGPAPVVVTIMEIQGAGHVSPFEGVEVTTTGVVTAIGSGGYYVQDPVGDGDDATSDGLFVFEPGSLPAVGDLVELTDTVSERVFAPELSGTQMSLPDITILSSGNAIPPPTIAGIGGRIPPNMVIEDDGLTSFDADDDGIDYWESLEGMRVQVNDAIVVAGTNRFDEMAIVGDNGVNAGPFSVAGGLLVSEADFNPEILLVDDGILETPEVATGDSFNGPIVGVLSYTFGAFKLFLTDPPPSSTPGGFAREATTPQAENELSIATFNVLNLDPGDSASKFAGLAEQVVINMASPDIISLQEIQDNTGPTDDGVVSADVVYTMLIDAIVAAGGPTYEFREIAPEDKQDGGQPGANIRVGFLFNPNRVTFIDRPGAGPNDASHAVSGASGVELTFSPGRINPTSTAFFESRKPLAGEFEFNGEKVFVVAAHFNSKSDDDGLYESVQPPALLTEPQRIAIAEEVNAFADEILALDPSAQVVVAGDLNDFEFRPALAALEGEDGALTNLISTVPANERYSFVFNGNSQVLDHILVSPSLAPWAVADYVHANVDHPVNDTDHDPVVARMVPDQTPPTVEAEFDKIWASVKTGLFRVEFSCEDTVDPDPTCVGDINGIPVEDGQKVFLIQARGRSWHKYVGHTLFIKAPTFVLTVTGTDDHGNTATETAKPEFRKRWWWN